MQEVLFSGKFVPGRYYKIVSAGHKFYGQLIKLIHYNPTRQHLINGSSFTGGSWVGTIKDSKEEIQVKQWEIEPKNWPEN